MREDRRSAQKRSGFWSINVSSFKLSRNDSGVSEVTCIIRSRVFRNSTKRLRKAIKCSAFRMFPGTASCKISSGSTGFAVIKSVRRFTLASCKPWTSLRYSSSRRSRPDSLILIKFKMMSCAGAGMLITYQRYPKEHSNFANWIPV